MFEFDCAMGVPIRNLRKFISTSKASLNMLSKRILLLLILIPAKNYDELVNYFCKSIIMLIQSLRAKYKKRISLQVSDVFCVIPVESSDLSPIEYLSQDLKQFFRIDLNKILLLIILKTLYVIKCKMCIHHICKLSYLQHFDAFVFFKVDFFTIAILLGDLVLINCQQ